VQHFPEPAWADFIRGISEQDTKANIEAHLAGGCSECKAAFSVLSRLQTVAAAEKACTPPDGIVRMAKLEFAVSERYAQDSSVLASLRFDTFAQPSMAGIRSSASGPRQLVFEAEGYTVDLRLDSRPPAQVLLMGQVLNKRMPNLLPGDTPIALWTTLGQPLVQVRTNESGEFHMEFKAQPQLRLGIDLAPGKTIRVPLPDFDERE
jgi:hypothetical protein